jgi:hypothetical protein
MYSVQAAAPLGLAPERSLKVGQRIRSYLPVLTPTFKDALEAFQDCKFIIASFQHADVNAGCRKSVPARPGVAFPAFYPMSRQMPCNWHAACRVYSAMNYGNPIAYKWGCSLVKQKTRATATMDKAGKQAYASHTYSQR